MADEERASLLRFGVGQRVHAAGNPRRIGTVRYVGTVDGYAGEWVGVDWDDGEGKHDGSVNGVRYFSAWGERSASLVRAKNLSAGISLIDALYMRYRGDTTQEEEDEMYVHSMSNKRVPIQLVGRHKVEEKLKRLEEIFSMSISYLGVSSIGSSHEISDLVPKLKELDLTGNLISKWQDIASLCKALPALEVLNLTSNFMADDTDIAEFPSLNNIRVLVLNNCGVTWEQVEKLKPSLASIKELHLMGNKLQRIVPSPPHTKFVTGFDSLFLLNLEDNFIGEWDEVVKFCHLRSLEQLHLNKNNLKHIYYPDPASQDSLDSTKIENRCDRAFNNLQCLLLGSNQIEDLASIDSLNFFPNLLYVRLSENPIADPVKGGLPRFVLVARLGKVKILNGSEISCRERKESEIRYVRLVMGKMQTENLAEIERLHPRFSELKLLHGIDDEKPVTGTTGPQKMASGFLSITLKCVGPSIGEKLPLTKKLPPNTTVGRLKTLCESFFKLKGIRPRLFSQEEGSPLPQLLDDDMASLVDLGIGSEATILVDEESS